MPDFTAKLQRFSPYNRRIMRTEYALYKREIISYRIKKVKIYLLL